MVHIFGWFNKSNCGDESYKLSLPLIFPNINFKFINQINEPMETCILGGGNIIAEPFLTPLKNTTCKKYALSVSALNKNSKENLEQLKEFEAIYVRDNKSLSILNSFNINAKYISDFAFTLKSNEENGRELLSKFKLCEKKVIVVINAHMAITNNPNDLINFEKMANAIATILDNINASFIFLPFCLSQPHDDRVTNAWVSAKCKKWDKNIIIYDYYTSQEVLNLFSVVDCVISSRYHASIFSTIAGKPFIDITHHDKNLTYLQEINKEH